MMDYKEFTEKIEEIEKEETNLRERKREIIEEFNKIAEEKELTSDDFMKHPPLIENGGLSLATAFLKGFCSAMKHQEDSINDARHEVLNDVCKWIEENVKFYDESYERERCIVNIGKLKADIDLKKPFPSDKTIMKILNAIGYEEESWIDFVRKRLNQV